MLTYYCKSLDLWKELSVVHPSTIDQNSRLFSSIREITSINQFCHSSKNILQDPFIYVLLLSFAINITVGIRNPYSLVPGFWMIGKTNWNPDISGIQIKYMEWKMSEYWTKWSGIQTPFEICTIYQPDDSFGPFKTGLRIPTCIFF